MDLSTRVDDLESRMAFQDDTIELLNDVIIKQQQQIDLLEQKIAALKDSYNEFLSGASETVVTEVPPHY